MKSSFLKLAAALSLGGCLSLSAKITPQQAAQLPPPANHQIDFTKEIKPIFEASCIKCHGRGKDKGGLRLDTRDTLLKGGDSGPAVVPGKSADSLLIELVQGFDPDTAMPKKGSKLTPEQISLLRAWIDQGLNWDANITFGRLEPNNLKPRRPQLPPGPKDANPIDRFLQPYFAAHQFKPPASVSDRIFARRVYLDIVGLLPSPEALAQFTADKHPAKRQRLVRSLLADNFNYAQNWMTFWNDALRNDYKGTGYIDGGRKQITGWLYAALATNMTYNRFVAQLINPTPDSEGFTKGIVWRGTVNASQTPQMQAAQNISQVFMGVNLKCASCHDSFVNDLTLADAYGLAGIYSEGALEMVHCDKPTGKKAELKFIYPELGAIDPKADKAARLQRLAQIITERTDARLTRTIVNRLWQKFMGHGLVEPVDDMEKPAWHADLLDFLAEDFADHDYDLKYLVEAMLTSRAYQLPAVSFDEKNNQDYVFRGPLVRRMSAEQFRDALAELTGVWYETPAAQVDFSQGTTNPPVTPPITAHWIWNDTNALSAAKVGTVYFRKQFKLDELPSAALAFTAADNSFTLYVNGKKMAAGTDYSRLYVTDLRKQLVKGTNTIAIEAINGGDKPNPAGLFFYACLRQHREDKHLIGLEQLHASSSSPPPGERTGVKGLPVSSPSPPLGERAGVRGKATPERTGPDSSVMDFGTDSSWKWSDTMVTGWQKLRFAAKDWRPAFELGIVSTKPWNIQGQFQAALAAPENFGKVRSVLTTADPLQVALGRPNREQTVTTRLSAATTLQALELTNGRELSDLIHRGAENIVSESTDSKTDLIPRLYAVALGRPPTADELKLAREVVSQPAQPAGVEDLLWSLTMLPEFQLIY